MDLPTIKIFEHYCRCTHFNDEYDYNNEMKKLENKINEYLKNNNKILVDLKITSYPIQNETYGRFQKLVYTLICKENNNDK